MGGEERESRRRGLAAAVAAVLGAAALVSACSTKTADRTCPQVIPATGADRIAIFRPGGGHDLKDVIVGGSIYSSDVKCEHEKTGVAVNTSIQFYAERANLEIPDTVFPYFVALVDPQDKVLAQEAFQLRVPFPPGESYRIMPPEKITVHLPLRNPAAAGAYSVIVGFQLTPDQIAFNRSAHRP